ncbi:serine/threonine-protein kinase [Actinomadura macrotermitis]|uniref:non-specific serine/threonine protein kinase n=1 Tax=Actinomadura macrotermitis TaxID=2585200 RepID=A0A7K0BVE9_9ACTN|nr:Serine/threonine-protein kinase PknD [Actinomadura macrotermitis]
MTEDLVLNGRYRLHELLATGGMGEVWRATDEALDREIAVKLLREELIGDDSAGRRFAAEARYAASLRHGGIAQVYDAREHEGRAYLVMELVPGEPLSRLLARTGGLPVERTLELVAQTAAGLAAAHAAGIVHRDIKPPNLMVTTDGTVKITDFGIARGLKAASQTQTGMVMGSAHYISPEQASGQQLTPAADLYSLGVVAYECLAGSPPFDGRTPVDIALQHVRDVPPPLPPRVPGPVRDLVAELLAKKPADRPAGAAEVAARARALLPGRDGQETAKFDAADRPDTLTKVKAAGQRRPALIYGSVAALVALAALTAGALWRDDGSAGLVRDEHSQPARPAPSTPPAAVPGTGQASPDVRRHPPATGRRHPGKDRKDRKDRRRTVKKRKSTAERPGASPRQKRNRQPARAASNAQEPAPAPAETATTPSTPSPAPVPVQGRRLGSEDKV